LDVQLAQAFEDLDKKWFSTVKDEIKVKYVEQLRKAIAKLNPRAFLQVGRTCQSEAIQTGQQIMCPDSHPVSPTSRINILNIKGRLLSSYFKG
jgi:hypothetical protein